MKIADVPPSPPKFVVVPVGPKTLTCAPNAERRSSERHSVPRRSIRMSPADGPLVPTKVVRVCPGPWMFPGA
jgi:hypothetical protein